MRSSSSSAAAAVNWPRNAAHPPLSLSLIVDGGAPFDRKTLEASGLLPKTPCTVLYCSELSGNTPIERNLALLDEIRRRKAAGEFSTAVPTLVFLHSQVKNGQLLVGDIDSRLSIPAITLLRALSIELLTQDGGASEPRPAPVVLSGCKAGAAAATLCDFPRPILINGGEHFLLDDDARAVLGASVRFAEHNWLTGQRPTGGQWREVLSSVSGAPLHQVGEGEWVEHQLLTSSSSLGSVSPRQAGLFLRSLLANGHVDELAEGLQLFGTSVLEADPALIPTMHLLINLRTSQLSYQIVLLSALGVPIDQRDQSGNTPLHIICAAAARQENQASRVVLMRLAVVRLLLANGADPQAKNHAGETPRSIAAASQMPRLLAALEEPITDNELALLGPRGLRESAMRQKWGSVLSLLDDPQQVMEVDDEDTRERSGDTDVPMQAARFSGDELAAAAGLVDLADTDSH